MFPQSVCFSLYLDRSWQYIYKQASFSQWPITGNSNLDGYCDYCCVTKYLKKFFFLCTHKSWESRIWAVLNWVLLLDNLGSLMPIATSKLSGVGRSKMTSLICVAAGTVSWASQCGRSPQLVQRGLFHMMTEEFPGAREGNYKSPGLFNFRFM